MKVLNLYAGIGGNRKLWSEKYEVTAVELDSSVASVYSDLFPKDTVIVEDAHEYLINNFKNFDFIWTSPPCTSHSRLRNGLQNDVIYPDMKLYQEIIILQKFFKGLFVVENVIPYYTPLIKPTFQIDRHNFWANFNVPKFSVKSEWRTGKVANEKQLLEQKFGYNLDKYKGIDKRKALRNAVIPELGNHILESAFTNDLQLF